MKIEVRKEVRDSILNDVNQTLSRLGISEELKETDVCDYGKRTVYNFETPAIKQMPVMFKELKVKGYISFREPEVKENETVPPYYEAYVELEYRYKHFYGGSNGCDIGFVIYLVDKDIPEEVSQFSFVEDDPYMVFIRKSRSLKI